LLRIRGVLFTVRGLLCPARLPIGVRTGILGRAKLLLSRNGLCRLGRSLALPIGVRTGILGRAKLLLSRNGLCRLGRSLALAWRKVDLDEVKRLSRICCACWFAIRLAPLGLDRGP
jgi:hypothetical protein